MLIPRQSEPNSANCEPSSCPSCICPKNRKVFTLDTILLIFCTWLICNSVWLVNLNDKLTVNENRPSSANKTISEMQREIDELKTETNQMENNLEDLQGYVYESVSDLESKCGKMEQQIQDLINSSNSVFGSSLLCSVISIITVSKVIGF